MDHSKSDFTQGSILKKLTLFMIPVLGALILQAAYGAVDLLVVGRFGTTAGLSAVSTGSQVLNLITFVVTQFAMGITVLIARYIGEKKMNSIGALIGGATVVFAIISAIIFVFMITLASPISTLMQAPKEALGLTATYVRICGAGIFFIVAYNLLSAIFRGLGDSKSPLLMLLFKRKLPFKITKHDFKINPHCVRALKIGLPLALQECLTQISFLALCAFINRLGLEASSGYGVACKIVNFAMLVPSSLMQSMASFVAQNVGAGDEKRAKYAMFTGMGIGLIIGVVVFILVLFKGDLLTSIFTTEKAVILQGYAYLKGFALETIVTAILFSMVGYFNGHYQTVWVMVQGLIQTLLVRLPLSYYMSIQPHANLTNIGLAAPIATIVGIILNVCFYIYLSKKMKKENA